MRPRCHWWCDCHEYGSHWLDTVVLQRHWERVKEFGALSRWERLKAWLAWKMEN